MSNILHNATVDTLLERRSIRKFKPKPLPDDVVETLETVAQHAASSQFLNDWSAIRVTEPAAKKRLAEIGGQPYIATAPLLYVFVLDEHRNAAIAARKGVEVASDAFTLNGSYRFTQAQNDAVLALHAMETAAYSLGLGCVILGSLLNDVPALIDLLNLPEYTYPVLGIAIGKPDQEPAIKPRMPRSMQFFENEYPSSDEKLLSGLDSFDAEVHKYYDLRDTERPVDAFSDQIAANAIDEGRERQGRCRAGEATGLPFGAVDRIHVSLRLIQQGPVDCNESAGPWFYMLSYSRYCPVMPCYCSAITFCGACSPSCGNVA